MPNNTRAARIGIASSLLLASAAAAAFGGCTGAISGGEGAGGDDDATCSTAPGRVGLQRLTRGEYNRTVRDLFGVTSEPANSFPPDSRTSGFDNNAGGLTVSPQLAKLLLASAEDVAAQALANRRNQIITCDPAIDGAGACGRATLSALALRVYRRPASPAELDDLMRLMQFAEAEGDSFDLGVEYALIAMLMAPQFLYRGVPLSAPAPGATVEPLDDYALASRLSYFLWGSTPDDVLLTQAARGLRDPVALRAEFDRMLADPKASAFYEAFVTQWLDLGKLAGATPQIPEFNEALRQDMLEETLLFFADLQARDGSPLDIIRSTNTFASPALAAIYGIPSPGGTGLSPVSTDPNQRAGVLTMPAILTMTSGPDAPNIVRRGVWLAEALLCAKPPLPPGGVPPAPDPRPGETERERLARHRADPSCASCHDIIDPLGFGFEHYDGIGRWRDDINGAAVDSLGALPDGTPYDGMVELSQTLTSGPLYPQCLTEKLMTYALGRTVRPAESCALAAIADGNVTPASKLSDLLWAIVISDAFQTQEIQEAP